MINRTYGVALLMEHPIYATFGGGAMSNLLHPEDSFSAESIAIQSQEFVLIGQRVEENFGFNAAVFDILAERGSESRANLSNFLQKLRAQGNQLLPVEETLGSRAEFAGYLSRQILERNGIEVEDKILLATAIEVDVEFDDPDSTELKNLMIRSSDFFDEHIGEDSPDALELQGLAADCDKLISQAQRHTHKAYRNNANFCRQVWVTTISALQKQP